MRDPLFILSQGLLHQLDLKLVLVQGMSFLVFHSALFCSSSNFILVLDPVSFTSSL